MTNGVIDTFWCGICTGCLWAALIESISSGDTIAIIIIGALFALFVTTSIFCIRKTSKEKTINQIIIRYVPGKDPMDELKRLSEVDK